MQAAEGSESEREIWWRAKRRPLSIAVVLFVATPMLCMLSRNSYAYIRADKDGHFRGVSVHRVADFAQRSTWNGTLHNLHFAGTKKLPHALLIGAKKAGTRALLEFIRVHPDVRAAGHEVHFFDRNYLKGLAWYRDMMPTSIGNQITMEKTPSYLITKESPKRVYEMNPDMKLVVVLKNPVDRAISDFTQSYAKHKMKRTFESSAFKDVKNLIVNESKPSIRTGVYSEHLKRWMKYFPLEQFCFVNGQNMVVHPAEELQKLQDFLNLKRVITEDYFYFNSTKGFPCLKKREASGVPHCLGKGKGRVHPDVSFRARAALYEYYEPFNEELYRLTGINYNWRRADPLEAVETG